MIAIDEKEVGFHWIWGPSIANINAHYHITARMFFSATKIFLIITIATVIQINNFGVNCCTIPTQEYYPFFFFNFEAHFVVGEQCQL